MPPAPVPAPHPPAPSAGAAKPAAATTTTQDFDQTLTYIEGLVPSLYVTLELIRALGHGMPPTPPPPA